MTNTVANVVQGKPVTTGGILIGTSGATLPTAARTTLTGFTALGYAADDGLSQTIDRTTDKIGAWGGDTVKVVQSAFSVTYQFTLIEMLNADALAAVFGTANVATTAATSSTGTLQAVQINAGTLPKLPWVFDMKDGLALIRVCVPLGQVTSVGDVTFNDSGVAGYQVTVEAFADSSGNQAYQYTDDGVFSA